MSNTNYDFWQKIINAIEAYTYLKSKKNSKYFFYSEMDFLPAFERFLYFDILGDASYTSKIKMQLQLTGSVLVKNEVHKELLSLAFPDRDFIVLRSFKLCIRKVIFKSFFLINFFLFLRSFNSLKSNVFFLSRSNDHFDFVFLVIHHKFIRYLHSLYSSLGSAVFLICDDYQASIDFCEKNSLKYKILDRAIGVCEKSVYDILSLTFLYEGVKSSIAKSNAKVILVPEGNAPINELANLAAASLALKTVCLQQGWSPVVHNGFRNMHYDVFLTWGSAFSKVLSDFNPNQKFVEVGSHVLGIKDERLDRTSIGFFLQAVDQLINEKDFKQLLDFARWVAETYPSLKVILREHPGHPLVTQDKEMFSCLDNVCFMNPQDYPLGDVLQECAIVVSIYSTVLFEGLSYNAIPFIFNPTALPKFIPDLVANGLGIEVKSLKMAKDAIACVLSDPDYCDIMSFNIESSKSCFFYSSGYEARCNILNILNDYSGGN